ncbi:MAG: alpha/beta hydrolase [Proteobacteria bacterium]|nr:alpha/beta hydrolase [Pseudomonadota bacterium]
MPLDPEVQSLLDAQDAAGEPSLETLPPRLARARYEAIPAPALPGLAGIEEHSLAAPDGALRVRVYTPRRGEPLACTLFLHGGGWVIGSPFTSEALCRRIALDADCAVVSVDYRLAPEHRFPTAAEDAYLALRWVAENAGRIEVDPARLAVLGASAGGNLAAAVALMARDRGGPELRLQVPVYPVIERDFTRASYLEFADGPGLTRAQMEWFWEQYLGKDGDATHPYASPLHAADLGGVAPALVITAEVDPLRDEGRAYADALRRAGVEVAYSEYAGVHHGFFGMGHLLAKARQATAEACAALRAHLGGGAERPARGVD